MANLLYVTGEMLETLRRHPAYLFWSPFVQNFPKRAIAIEERSFYGRDVEVEEGLIYLTIDMNFVYCRNGMVSFLYDDQDLSYRFTVADGVLRTMDNHQFNALIGAVASVVSSAEVELINSERVFHPYLDAILAGQGSAATVSPIVLASAAPAPTNKGKEPRAKKSSGRKASSAKSKEPAATDNVDRSPPVEKSESADYSGELRDKIFNYKQRTKKSFQHVAERFDLSIDVVKEICRQQRGSVQSKAAAGDSGDDVVDQYPAEMCERIMRMKTVSKKSYTYVAEKFDLPIDTVKLICARYLQRPRTDKE